MNDSGDSKLDLESRIGETDDRQNSVIRWFANSLISLRNSVEGRTRRISPRIPTRATNSAIAGSNAGAAAGINIRLRIYNDTHWCLVQPDPDSGKVVLVHGGTYKFDGTSLEEKTDFAGDDIADLIGQTSKFRIVFGKGSFEQIDPDGAFSETWKRTGPRTGKAVRMRRRGTGDETDRRMPSGFASVVLN